MKGHLMRALLLLALVALLAASPGPFPVEDASPVRVGAAAPGR